MGSFKEYESFDGLGLASLIQRGVISQKELLQAAIERIETYNPELNAVIYKMYDEAVDALNNEQFDGPFKGVPFLLKDLLAECCGAPTRMGSYFTVNAMSKSDSEIVRRFKSAGVVILGKTNAPEFGLSPVTEPKAFGPTKNPWNLEYSPGGSSGGSAAAVASHMVPIAHGGDGGGSLRIPASYCGIFGFKPSRGRTPVGPNILRIWQGMVCQHVLTRTVRDSAAMLDVIVGPELGSPISLPKPGYSFLENLENIPQRLKIAVVEKPFFQGKVHPDYINALHQTAKLCEDLGHDVEFPSIEIANDKVALSFLIMMAAENATHFKILCEQLGKKPARGDLEVVTDLVLQAGEIFSATDYVSSLLMLDDVGIKLARFFTEYDVMMTPAVACPPPRIGEFKAQKLEQRFMDFLRWLPNRTLLRRGMRLAARRNFSLTPFTPPFNFGGNPAMSVPLFKDSQGLPIGIQFAAKAGDDLLLLQLARQLEAADLFIQPLRSVNTESIYTD